MAIHGITHHGTTRTITTTGWDGIIIITTTLAIIGIDLDITMVTVHMVVGQVLLTTTRTDQVDRLIVAVSLQAQGALQLALQVVEDV